MSESEQDELVKSLIAPIIDIDEFEFDGSETAQFEAECLITWFQVNE